MKPKTALWASISGTVLIAVCCATPVLAITLGALVGYLDYVLLPALVVMVVVSIISYQRYLVIVVAVVILEGLYFRLFY